jgi:hypothetical protein
LATAVTAWRWPMTRLPSSLLHAQQLVALALQHRSWECRSSGDDARRSVRADGHFFTQHGALLGFGLGQLPLFKAGDDAILQLARLGESPSRLAWSSSMPARGRAVP